jgi:hypothetical protein
MTALLKLLPTKSAVTQSVTQQKHQQQPLPHLPHLPHRLPLIRRHRLFLFPHLALRMTGSLFYFSRLSFSFSFSLSLSFYNAVSDEYASLALPLVRLCPLQVQQGLAAVHVGDVRGAVRVKKSLSPATAATYASSANVVTVTGVESKRQEEVKTDKTTDDQQTEDPNDCRSTRVMSVATRAEDKDGAVRSFAAYMETHRYFRLCGLLRGRSKHGKSYMARRIQDRYAKQGISVVVVSRDDVLCDVAASADKSIRLSMPVTGEQYKQCRAVYEEKKLSSKVNMEMCVRIEDAYRKAPGTVVLVDTLMTSFESIVTLFLPHNLHNTFFFAVNVVRKVPLTQADAARLGMTLEDHLQLAGEYSPMKWMNVGTSLKIVSARSDRSSPLRAEPYTAHLVFGVALIANCASNKNETGDSDCQHRVLNLSGLWYQLDVIAAAYHLYAPIALKGLTVAQIESGPCITATLTWLVHTYGWKGMLEYLGSLHFDTQQHPPTADLHRLLRERRPIPCPKNPATKWESHAGWMVTVMYQEGQCKLMNALALGSRGTVCYLLDPASGNFVLVKASLFRGGELVVRQHETNNIDETENMKRAELARLTTQEGTVVDALLSGDKKDWEYGSLSFKVDGSLMNVVMVPKSIKLAAMLETYIMQQGDAFAQANLVTVRDVLKLPFVGFIASKATLLAGAPMHDYYITSMLVEMGIMTDDELRATVGATRATPVEVWLKYGAQAFWKRFHAMDQGFRAHQFIVSRKRGDAFPVSVSVTYALESVCANVTTGWGVVHRELACQYGKSSLRILGAAFGETDVTYSPHMEWSGVLLAAGFQEPLYWVIVEPARVDDMLETLSGVLRKTIAADEFYTRHPPSNPAFLLTHSTSASTSMLASFVPSVTSLVPASASLFPKPDFEGFVLYVKLKGIGPLFYGKVKTSEYYKTHKAANDLTPAQIDYLVKLYGTAPGVFLSCDRVGQFFSARLPSRLDTFAASVAHELKTAAEGGAESTHPLVTALDPAARDGWKKAFGSSHQQQQQQRHQPIDSTKMTVQFRILIGAAASKMFLMKALGTTFPEFTKFSTLQAMAAKNRKLKVPDMDAILKDLCFKLEPWSAPNHRSKISQALAKTYDKRLAALLLAAALLSS